MDTEGSATFDIVPDMAMRTAAELEAELNTIRDIVNEGNYPAEIIWDTLRWALGEEGVERPVPHHVDETL